MEHKMQKKKLLSKSTTRHPICLSESLRGVCRLQYDHIPTNSADKGVHVFKFDIVRRDSGS